MKTISRILAALILAAGTTFVAAGSASAATPKWLSISAGDEHTCAIATNHALYCWGKNTDGQLGIGPASAQNTPQRVGSSTSWSSVSAGSAFTCARHESGSLYCWGNGASGQLGLGDFDDRNTPKKVVTTIKDWASVDASGSHVCARRAAGSIYCWGNNGSGELGQGAGNPDDRSTPGKVGTSTSWKSVSTGGAATCALHENAAIYCWGSNGQGHLGIGNVGDKSSPTKIPAPTKWTSVSVGQLHTCARHATGSLYCWGYNNDGQLGTGGGGFSSKYTPQKVGTSTSWTGVTAGSSHTCAKHSSGSLYCWGLGTGGRLGTGDGASKPSPAKVGTSTSWTTVSAGGMHTCALLSSGSAYCWGTNSSGQLGTSGGPSAVPKKIV
jgi:alpha-tubulin suppressor-like RCC1 family protein